MGVEIFSEPPADARESLGPTSGTRTDDLLPRPPARVRAVDVEGIRISELLDRFRSSSPDALAMIGPSVGPKTKSYTREHWVEVARVVTMTRADGDHRTAQAVQRRWTVSHPTAISWIARARAEGLLPRV